MSMSYLIIGITALVSISAFSNPQLLERCWLHPYRMKRQKSEIYRLLTSGFVHADYTHLGFNMLTLFFFGPFLENQIGGTQWLILYIGAVIISSIPSFVKKNNISHYRSLGASGGVAAIIFATIYIAPWNNILIFFVLPLPSILFAILYLIYSAYMAKKGGDMINHDAHFWGSVFGLLFMIVIADPSHGRYFINQLLHPPFF